MRKIPVGIVGVSGVLGRQFLSLLADHPWFEIKALIGSDKTVGKRLGDVLGESFPLSHRLLDQVILAPEAKIPVPFLFSAVKGEVAFSLEQDLVKRGYKIVTCAYPSRMDLSVPLVIPEVNPDHLSILDQKKGGGWIVAKPNCSVTGICLPLAPIHQKFCLEKIEVTTLQAISGAGLPGVPALEILDNVIPYIPGEEDRIREEPKKLFGEVKEGQIVKRPLTIGVTATRVPVLDGHLALISFSCQENVSLEEIRKAWEQFKPPVDLSELPSAPAFPILYLEDPFSPQPRLHRMRENGMGVTLGRLRTSPHFQASFISLSHNALRGGAKGAILMGELLAKKGLISF